MRLRWRGLELPAKVVWDPDTLTDSYGVLTAEPFERGFGITLGNCLRRILLACLEGAGVTSIRIEGAKHEFTSIPGVVEDMADIVLNIKRLRVRVHGEEDLRRVKIQASGKGPVTAADIQEDQAVEVVNKDLHIATMTAEDSEFQGELEVRRGRGYVTAAENQRGDQEIGLIPVDTMFSPVTRVAYRTEDTRVGKLTRYDRLIMQVWTNGVLTPQMAVVEASKILRKHLNPFVQSFDLSGDLVPQAPVAEASEGVLSEEQAQALRAKLDKSVAELNLSVRASNCLEAAGIQTVGQLVEKAQEEMLGIRNFGKTSLDEIEGKLVELDLSFGMKIPPELSAVGE